MVNFRGRRAFGIGFPFVERGPGMARMRSSGSLENLPGVAADEMRFSERSKLESDKLIEDGKFKSSEPDCID